MHTHSIPSSAFESFLEVSKLLLNFPLEFGWCGCFLHSHQQNEPANFGAIAFKIILWLSCKMLNFFMTFCTYESLYFAVWSLLSASYSLLSSSLLSFLCVHMIYDDTVYMIYNIYPVCIPNKHPCMSKSRSHIWEKNMQYSSFRLWLICFTCWCPVPCIFLQMISFCSLKKTNGCLKLHHIWATHFLYSFDCWKRV